MLHQIGRQHVGRHPPAVIQHHDIADDVQQLAHISRPGQLQEQPAHLRIKAVKGPVFFRRKPGQGRFGNFDHIRAPVAQGRHMDGNDIQAVVQVFAELSPAHRLQRVAVGGADDPDVHLARPRGPDRLHHGCLQKPQQFGLQRHIHFADLVQKQRAPIRRRRRARLVGNRPGKAALHMAEHFGLQQIGGNRTAVQGNERAGCAGGPVMNGLGTKFLAGPAFASDEHGRHRRRDRPDFGIDPLHCHA